MDNIQIVISGPSAEVVLRQLRALASGLGGPVQTAVQAASQFGADMRKIEDELPQKDRLPSQGGEPIASEPVPVVPKDKKPRTKKDKALPATAQDEFGAGPTEVAPNEAPAADAPAVVFEKADVEQLRSLVTDLAKAKTFPVVSKAVALYLGEVGAKDVGALDEAQRGALFTRLVQMRDA